MVPRKIRVFVLAICASVVATAGWGVLGFGGILLWIFEDANFPKQLFWTVLGFSALLFFIFFYRYLNKHER